MQPFDSVRDLVAENVYDARQQAGGAQVPRPAAQPGDHRVEERRAEEGVRPGDRPGASRQLRAVDGPPRGMNDAWYAIWTRSRHEQRVREQLERKGYEAFLPTVPKWSRWKDRKQEDRLAAVSGILLRALRRRRQPADPEMHRGREHRLVRRRHRARSRIRRSTAIRQLVTSDLQFDPCPLIREGMMVEVVHGPLKGVRRPAGAQGRPRAADAVGRSHRPGGERGSGRGGRASGTDGTRTTP